MRANHAEGSQKWLHRTELNRVAVAELEFDESATVTSRCVTLGARTNNGPKRRNLVFRLMSEKMKKKTIL